MTEKDRLLTSGDGSEVQQTGSMSEAAQIRQKIADVSDPAYGDDWTRQHKGDLRRIEGFIWECGDDHCRCEQAIVKAVFNNRVTGNSVIPIGLWEGTFHTEGDYGDGPSPDAELAAFRRALRVSDPDTEARIVWQSGVDYEQ